MNVYLYVKSGHNIGLEQVRRASVLYKQLESCDPIMCTADYRAATFARELGVYKGIGIDVIGNLPNIMERSDILIFESDEPSDTMRTFMKEYCTKLFEVGVDIPKALVDDKFFKKGNHSISKTFFFGDDDYEDMLLKELCTQKVNINLLMGHYFFLGSDDKLAPYFDEIIDEEDYFETILNTKYLLTSSLNATFESLASGNNPVFYQRANKNNDDLELIKKFNIPIVDGKNITEIVNNFESVIKNYPEVKALEKVDTSKIIDDILKTVETFNKLYV
jgi:hypothetical protein